MKKLLCCLAIGLSVTGCATTKISPEERNKLNQTQTLIKTNQVAVISDGCLIRSELGTSLIEGEQSRLTAQKFAALLSSQLNEQGVTVSHTFMPFVCGLMPEEQLKKYDYRLDSETKRAEIKNYPLVSLENKTLSEQQQQALLNLNQSFNKQVALALKNAKEKKPVSNLLELSDQDVTVIKDLTQSNYAFIASVTGTDASFGKKFTAGALSVGVTLATVGAGSGLVTAYIPQEGQQYVVHIVDLNNKTIMWTKAGLLMGKPYSKKNHSVEAKAILNPLFEVVSK
ncbi:hypothetical protein [Acinetobacter vivianii]|uniref:hypothetical protein n=1 Tax=Acinetobacter vivianii TaxID=1776742 RepID=UPI002DBFE234|nr:hypothetical protein [Acinetobacter vivianii]MEB6480642.1 hypothetical protein [Acinetobacter vivianii]MEB6658926.1 hypothetical protein [Acinetobacter vivianii]